ncbi:MAG TPA: hypothetical protein VIT65_13840 [Microlunatus sp.]
MDEQEKKTLGELSVVRAGVITKVVLQQLLRRHGIEMSKEQVGKELDLEVKTIVAAGMAAGGSLVFEWLVKEQKELLANPVVGFIKALDPDSVSGLTDAFGLDSKAAATLAGIMHKQSGEAHEEWALRREVTVDGDPL